MLQQPHSLLLNKLVDHVAQNGSHGIKPLISLTDVLKAKIVEEDLLNDENGHGLAQFAASLHDTETKRDDFGGEEKVDDFAAIVLDKGANDAERGETEVFEGSGLGGGVEEWIEEEGDVCCRRSVSCMIAIDMENVRTSKKQASGLAMRGDTLKQS